MRAGRNARFRSARGEEERRCAMRKDETAAGPKLSHLQRNRLRKEANSMRPALIIGKKGIGEETLKQLDALLEARGLVKIKLLDSCPVDRDEAAGTFERELGCATVLRIGRVLVCYRRRKRRNRKAERRGR